VSTIGHKQFDALRAEIEAKSFRPQSADSRRIGAEVEFLVVDEANDRPLPLLGEHRGLISRLRRHSALLRWSEQPGYGAISTFATQSGATISFEPGGQLEISSAPAESASSLIASLRSTIDPLRAVLQDEGIRLDAVGIDPHNDARDIPLQLNVERYERMTAYFERIGPYGIRMMRQTAAIQLSIDRGVNPVARWRLLNDLAPYVIAMFANSPHYLGEDTGHQSYRAHCWRALDPTRTGIAENDDDPAAAYTRFALNANDILGADASGACSPFAERVAREADFGSTWKTHLTTLFPEVRPRGHFEVRSCDAIDTRWLAAPIVMMAALAYDATAAREAAFLAAESRALLRIAGVDGLCDEAIARTSRDLFQLALAGARRLGLSYVSADDLDTVEAFYAQFTGRSRAPASVRAVPTRRVAGAALRAGGQP
jgi:glutamate--cysteine ligase